MEAEAMNEPSDHDELLDAIEAELAEIGCFPTESARDRMAMVLDQIDRLNTSEASRPRREALEKRLREMAQRADRGLIRDAPAWLASAECA